MEIRPHGVITRGEGGGGGWDLGKIPMQCPMRQSINNVSCCGQHVLAADTDVCVYRCVLYIPGVANEEDIELV